MKRAPLPDQETLHSLLDYDLETGALTWRRRPESSFATLNAARTWNTKFAGAPALISPDKDGYLCGTIARSRFRSHRVIWKMVYGEDPIEIDHINRIRHDNRLSNLRHVDKVTNHRNKRLFKNNKSGVPGVYWQQDRGKWIATIGESGKSKTIGRFDDFDAAVAARKAAERQYGFHPNHGRAA